MQDFLFERFENKRTLIKGETSSGKTKITASLLREAISRIGPLGITVLDFAPSQRTINGLRIGGRIRDFLPTPECQLREPAAPIRAPRLESHHADEVLKLAEDNALLTSALLRQYLASPTPCLFINDLTIHLHAGSLDLLLEAIRKSSTFVGNAYSGAFLEDDRGAGVSRRERQRLRAVAVVVDIVVDLSEPTRQAAQSIEHDG